MMTAQPLAASNMLPSAAIGGGVAGGVMLLVIVVIISICIGKRMRMRSKDGTNRESGKQLKNDLHRFTAGGFAGKSEHRSVSSSGKMSEYGNMSAVGTPKSSSSEYGEAPVPSRVQAYGAAPSKSKYASARDLPNEAPGEHYKEFVNAQQLEEMNREAIEARLSSQASPGVPRAPYAQLPH